MRLRREEIVALIQSTLIGFEEELTKRDRDFIADQIARKIEYGEREARVNQQSTEKP